MTEPCPRYSLPVTIILRQRPSLGNDLYEAMRTFNYAYETNAPCVSAISLSGSHPFTVTRTYEADRPLLASIETKWSTTSAVKFAYTHNDRGQRRVAVQSGSAFADYYVSGSYSAISRHFTYNTRGELETEAFYRGEVTGTPSSGDALPGRRDEFRYDSIGNRKTSGQTGSANTADDEYTANALNQYTERENNLVPFRGTTPTTSTTVAISGVIVNQLDRVWAGDLEPANTTQAVKGSVTINTTSPTSSENRGYFALKRWQTFGYDDDGNVTHDSEWDYTWDAENRLVLMEHRSEVVGTGMLANADKRRIEFRYDYQSRRVRKTVYGGWNGSSFNAIPLSDTKYLYDGWNLVAEFSVGGVGALTLARSYTWGLDLIGSLTASGGVGALLQIHDHAAGKTLLPAYDGNGNVVALLNDTSGDLEAVYDYSPFGKLVRSTGTYAEANAFRFSTKFTDSETGLVYYGYRYYSPTLGRFLGRDPIEESGGVNLYAFVGNNAVNAWDYLGMRGGEAPMTDMIIPKDPDWYDLYGDGGGSDGSNPISAPVVAGLSPLERSAARSASLRAVYNQMAAFFSAASSAMGEINLSMISAGLASVTNNIANTLYAAASTTIASNLGTNVGRIATLRDASIATAVTSFASVSKGSVAMGSMNLISYSYSETQAATTRGTGAFSGNAPNSGAGSSTYDNGSKAIAGAGAVQTAVGLAGTTGASIGSNGKVYTSGWGGNQYVTTAKVAEVATKAGFVLAAAGTAWDWINVFNGSGSISGTKATVNTGFTGLGLLGGPMGAAGGAGYFLIDNFYPGGWLGNGSNQPYNGAGALRDYGTTIENNQKIVPGWKPRDPPF